MLAEQKKEEQTSKRKGAETEVPKSSKKPKTDTEVSKSSKKGKSAKKKMPELPKSPRKEGSVLFPMFRKVNN